jgi:hypothetical protein
MLGHVCLYFCNSFLSVRQLSLCHDTYEVMRTRHCVFLTLALD